MSGPEGRSVGDLLLECDLTARRLLVDPDALDAGAMLRVWPELVQAGHELLNALPGDEPEAIPGVSVKPAHVDPVGERLHLMATALNDTLRRRTWPGDGPVDDRLLTIAGHLVRAHDLIERRLRATGPLSSSATQDAAAARTRVLHTLYVTSHAVSLATRAEARDLQASNRAARSRWAASKLATLRLAGTRIDRFEEFAGAEVYRSFPAALDGQQRPSTAPDRLREAVAMWEVETHRALVADPTLGNIVELARVQSGTIALSHLLLQGAADAGVIDASTYRTRLAPRLNEAASAWSSLHATVRDLTSSGNRHVARDLRVAGSELIERVERTGTRRHIHRRQRSARGTSSILRRAANTGASPRNTPRCVTDPARRRARPTHTGGRKSGPARHHRAGQLASAPQVRTSRGYLHATSPSAATSPCPRQYEVPSYETSASWRRPQPSWPLR